LAYITEQVDWRNRDVISILDFSRSQLEELFELAERFLTNTNPVSLALSDKVISTAFFEPSTRTRLSFSAAALRLGAKVIDLSSEASSLAKGESFADTIKMLEGYSDLTVLRHPSEGAALLASELSSKPIINGGDGSQHHPTQAMLDLFTVKKLKQSVDGLTYAVVGDIRYGRAATSFLYGLTKFKPRKIYIVSPEVLRPKKETIEKLFESGLFIEEKQSLSDVIEDADVIYVTRVQKERIPDIVEYDKVKGSYQLTKRLLTFSKKDSIVLHPLPRLEELPYEIDFTPNAAYMQQAKWGVPLRMALLSLILQGDRQ
jgi:aspartate carbamoyltransferase catalytic subunit